MTSLLLKIYVKLATNVTVSVSGTLFCWQSNVICLANSIIYHLILCLVCCIKRQNCPFNIAWANRRKGSIENDFDDCIYDKHNGAVFFVVQRLFFIKLCAMYREHEFHTSFPHHIRNGTLFWLLYLAHLLQSLPMNACCIEQGRTMLFSI